MHDILGHQFSPNEFNEAWETLDKDGTGFIDATVLKKLVSNQPL